MKEVLILKKPVKINGEEVTELTYDAEEITSEGFINAEANKQKATTTKTANKSGAYELDYSLHLYLGMAAIIAVNEHITFEDLARIKGPDVLKVMDIGRNFILKNSEEQSQENSSEIQSEPIQEDITPQLLTSENGGLPSSSENGTEQ